MAFLNVFASLLRTLLTVSLALFATSLASAAISYIEGLHHELLLSIATLAISGLTSLFLWLASRRLAEYGIATYIEAIYVVVLTWTISSFFCTIPFLLAGLDFLDSLFEVVSGLTGTGLTVIKNISSWPILIRLWRSVLQWFGEMGIIVTTLAVFSKPGSPIMYLYVAEGREERLSVTVLRTVKLMLRIYLVYTVACAILYALSGVDIFDAVCLAMTTIATGGFSPITGGFSKLMHHVHNWALLYVSCIVFMIIGALNFRDHARLFQGKIRDFFSPELRLFLSVCIVLSFIVALSYMCYEHINILHALELGFFHTISAITTTGFQLSDLSKCPDLIKLLLTLAMVIGGCTCSTAGGIKVLRFGILFKSLSWSIQEVTKPRGALIRRVAFGIRLETETIVRILQFMLLYLLLLLLFSLILVASGYRFVDSLFEVASAMGCAGLSVGITSMSMPAHCKILLIIAMLIGRLEILPWIIAFGNLIESIKRAWKSAFKRP